MTHKGKRIFITGIPTSGKSYLAKQLADKVGGVAVLFDDFRENLAENPEYKKWTNFYLDVDEKEYLTKTIPEKQWENLIAQSEGLWPAFLQEIQKYKDETKPVIFECVNILPHIAKKHLDFPGIVLIGKSYEEILERNIKSPRWGNTHELQELEAKTFFEVERLYYKAEAEKYRYEVFEDYDDAFEKALTLISDKKIKIHLDTDFGGDIDDICALALLLKSPEAEITGITTVAENSGKRAGQVKYTLNVANRENILVKAGADNSGGFYPSYLGLPSEEKYWPESITPLENTTDEALELLKSSIEQGAKIVAIGPLTNLYLLDIKYPGILKQTEIFFMGGYVHSPRSGFPDWKNEWDFNKQIDIKSAKHVFANSNITLVQLSVTEETFITESDIEPLKKAGPLGILLAKQAEEWKKDEKISDKYKDCKNIPKDIINFQYDPLTVAVALGWNGVEVEELSLIVEEKDNILHECIDDAGKIFKVVTKVDGIRFNNFWLEQITKN